MPSPANRWSGFLRMSGVSFGLSALIGGMLTPFLGLAIVGACHQPEGMEKFEFILLPVKIVGQALTILCGSNGHSMVMFLVSGAIGYGLVGWVIAAAVWALWKLFERHSGNQPG